MKETFKIYEKLPIPKEKTYIGVKTGVIHNEGKSPAFFQDSKTGIKYPFRNYEFEIINN